MAPVGERASRTACRAEEASVTWGYVVLGCDQCAWCLGERTVAVPRKQTLGSAVLQPSTVGYPPVAIDFVTARAGQSWREADLVREGLCRIEANE
jgi:hypothetical protein